jgi:hypothetical protein
MRGGTTGIEDSSQAVVRLADPATTVKEKEGGYPLRNMRFKWASEPDGRAARRPETATG